MAGPLAEANLYRFSSKEWHANAGLYYYGFRYYEPNLQRWINRDPIEEKGGINLSCFARNHPLVLIDPFGLTCAPGFWEGLIPFWGSGKQAIHDFEEGKWGWGIFNTAMAATDIIPGATLVKAGLKAGGKVGVRALWKTGSHNWPSTQAWYKRVHELPDHMNTHHALVPQRHFEGTKAEALFNQLWNLKPLDPKVPKPPGWSDADWYRAWHNAVEGKANTLVDLNLAKRWWHGAPDWAKAAEVSLTGDLVNAALNPHSNGCPE
ncbi:MAG: RHS repeat-associated core domain-containing protein [Verrucomicrobiae bacterium]|nr:RHS repeat-associated core domain-containing protein [Verrucomicrobiae bacterium]